MLLNITERLLLLTLTRDMEGNVATLKAVRQFQDAAGFSDDEVAVLDFEQVEGRLSWKNGEQIPEKDVEVSVPVAKAVSKLLKALDKAGKLRFEHMSLYEKFVPEGED